jgi:hypothetical protein
MAAWRRRALELFPEFQGYARRPYPIWDLFIHLHRIVETAHLEHDDGQLKKVYGFAEWCLNQRDLWNAISVGFYEALFEMPVPWRDVVDWLSPFVIKECRPLWQLIDGERAAEIDDLVKKRKSRKYAEVLTL